MELLSSEDVDKGHGKENGRCTEIARQAEGPPADERKHGYERVPPLFFLASFFMPSVSFSTPVVLSALVVPFTPVTSSVPITTSFISQKTSPKGYKHHHYYH